MKVGDYCYIKNCRKYGIGQIQSFENNNNLIIAFKNNIRISSIGNVISSSDLIDLVDIGDYVNGYKVIELGVYQDNEKCITVDFDMENDNLHWGQINEFTNKDIKSVVTKEQFKNVEYIVGE